MRKLRIALTSREIDAVAKTFDRNEDGMINWREFCLKVVPHLNKERASACISRLRDLMTFYMISPRDAFRLYDKDNTGQLQFGEFVQMLTKLYECGKEELPAYPILKDLFEIVDLRNDGVIDANEWNRTFKSDGEKSRKVTPSALIQFESKERADLFAAISRCRKLLKEEFERASNAECGGGGRISVPLISKALDKIVGRSLSPEQIASTFSMARVEGEDGLYDYQKIIEVFKAREASKNTFPKTV